MHIAGTALLIASGPSLSLADVDACKGRAFTIAINDNYRIAPWADVLYACDGLWWDHHFKKLAPFKGELWTQDKPAADRYGLHWIQGKHGEGLSADPNVIHWGANSGYQAINLAYNWGAKRIVLLGFDCRRDKGRTHWFGDHPKPLTSDSPYGLWLTNFRKLAADLKAKGVEVFNCSPNSAIDAFQKVPLGSVFPASSATALPV